MGEDTEGIAGEAAVGETTTDEDAVGRVPRMRTLQVKML